MGIKFDDEVLALMVLASLPESWETLKVSITNSSPNGVVSMATVKSGILNEEMRRRSQGVSTSQSEVLATATRGRTQDRSQSNSEKSKGKSNKFANVECHHCKKKGHIKKFCRKFKKEQTKKNKGKDVEEEESSDEESNSICEFNVVYSCDVVNMMIQETSWIIDSGATIHATSRREFFSSYTPGDFGTVKMGNDNSSLVVGKGDVCLETMNGTKLILRDVRHVPDMRLNLISVDKLDEEGYCNTFCNGQWKLIKGSLVVAKGMKQSKLYVTQLKISQQDVNVAEDDDKIQLWHRRVGHEKANFASN